jgi:hypothetical protein
LFCLEGEFVAGHPRVEKEKQVNEYQKEEEENG